MRQTFRGNEESPVGLCYDSGARSLWTNAGPFAPAKLPGGDPAVAAQRSMYASGTKERNMVVLRGPRSSCSTAHAA